MNGVWKVVGIGAAGLASELGTFEKKNPLINQNEMILRVLQLDCEFLLIPSDQGIKSFNAYFLKSATIVFDQPNDYQSSYPLNQVLTSIKNKFGNK